MQEKPSKACFRTLRGLDAADAVHSCFFSEWVFRGALKMIINFLFRQHRTKIVRQKRCQIFRQIVQKFCRHTIVCQEIYVQDDGKEHPKEVPLGYKFMTCKVVRRALCGVALKKGQHLRQGLVGGALLRETLLKKGLPR